MDGRSGALFCVALTMLLSLWGCDSMTDSSGVGTGGAEDRPNQGSYSVVTLDDEGTRTLWRFESGSKELIHVEAADPYHSNINGVASLGKAARGVELIMAGNAVYVPGAITLRTSLRRYKDGRVSGMGRLHWDFFDTKFTAECVAGPLLDQAGRTFYAVVGEMQNPVSWAGETHRYLGFSLETSGALSLSVILSPAPPTEDFCYWSLSSTVIPPARGQMHVKEGS